MPTPMMSTFTTVVIGIVAVIIEILAILLWRRKKFIKAVQSRGWSFNPTCDDSVIIGLNQSPFGVGFNRKADDMASGTTSTGRPFRAFEYYCSEWSTGNFAWVVTIPLAQSYQDYHLIHHNAFLPDIEGIPDQVGQFNAYASSADFRSALTPVISDLAHEMLGFNNEKPLSISVDHNQLCVLGVRQSNLDDSATIIELADQMATRIDQNPSLTQFSGVPVPTQLAVQHRPFWEVRDRDDSLLEFVASTRSGYDHRATNIVICADPVLPFIALEHSWKTKTTGSDGKTRVSDHSEEIFEIRPQFSFADLGINTGMLSRFTYGPKVEFESIDFNKEFSVRSSNPRFAYDVIHPRQMEYLLAQEEVFPFGYSARDGVLRVQLRDIRTSYVVKADEVIRGFLRRIPGWVWENLGHQQPPQV